MKYGALFVLALVLTAGCISQDSGKNQEPTTTVQGVSPAPASSGDTMKKTYAVIETDKGTMKALLYTGKAPISTENFIGLAERGFYDGLIFHRVEPGFVIQTGDPEGTGRGGSGKSIPLEIHPDLKHELGALGMARTNDPNSATSQFYVVTGEAGFLDGNYAVFGKLVEGIEVAQKIKVGDKMESVKIVEE
ncbi:MAG: peptidylprolyl isomerase [Candidatus Altiarchaeota archaeon]